MAGHGNDAKHINQNHYFPFNLGPIRPAYFVKAAIETTGRHAAVFLQHLADG
jgi:hypothetical protein